MTATDVEFSLIETALYLSVFGNITTGNAVTEYVGIMFSRFMHTMLMNRLFADHILRGRTTSICGRVEKAYGAAHSGFSFDDGG